MRVKDDRQAVRDDRRRVDRETSRIDIQRLSLYGIVLAALILAIPLALAS